ncbi:MAG: zinc-ribbon domain-containing protein [Lachnospiraceae bacterium]
MFCNQCGSPLADDAVFCPKCGAKRDIAANPVVNAEVTPAPGPVPSPAEPSAKKKKLLPVILGIAAVVVVALVAVFVFMFGGSSSGNYDKYSKDYVAYAYSEYIYNSDGKVYEADSDIYSVAYSADNSVLAYTMQESDYTQTLYYMTEDFEPKMVDEEVVSFKVSYNGAYIAYIKDVNDAYTSGDLYLYCIKDGKTTHVDSDVYPNYFCVSPGGKTVAYLKDYESYNDNALFIGGISVENTKVDKDGSTPVAVSDNGKSLYYLTDNDKLYFYNGKESVKISSDVYSDIYFNNALTEVIYTKNSSTYYYTPKMDDPVKITGSYLYGVAGPDDLIYSYVSSEGCIVGKDTLKNSVIITDSGLYWFKDAKTDAVRITSSYSDYQISADGKSLLYVNSGDLYKISKLSEKMEAKKLYDDEYVDYFVASADLSKVYIEADDELYYVKNEKKTERITNDMAYGSFVYCEDMDKVFFVEDETLCYAGTTAKSKVTVEEDVDDVYKIMGSVVFEIYSEKNYEYTYYIIVDKKPVELFTD